MRSVNNKVNFSEETGITDEAISAYVDGALNPTQKELFEKLLADDPFAQEALEGWQQVSDKVSAHSALKQIESKIIEKTGYQNVPVISINYRQWILAAASIALLIGVAYGVLHVAGNLGKNENMAQAEDLKPIIVNENANTPVASDSLLISTSISDSSLLSSTSQLQSANTTNQSTTATMDADKDIASEKTTSEPFSSQEDLKLLAEGAKTKETSTFAEKKAETDKYVALNENKANSSLENSVAKPSAVTPSAARGDIIAADMEALAKVSARDAARLKFDSKNYRDAALEYKSILQNSPDDAEALYFGGISEYFIGDINNAEVKFDKLLKGKRGYSDGSVWYKANILLRKGQRKEAVKMLKNLSEGTGNFKERATTKLNEIGE